MQSNHLFGDTIYSYTRAQAIEDGVLVDVTNIAQEAGIQLPAAVTQAVWDQYIEWSDQDTDLQVFQDETGRLWDMMWLLRTALFVRKRNKNVTLFDFYVVPRDGRSRSPVKVQLKVIISVGDQVEPVITVMLPFED